MSRIWTDRVADRLIDYLHATTFIQPMGKRAEERVYLKLLFEIAREQKRLAGGMRRRLARDEQKFQPVLVPLDMAKDLWPEQMQTVEGRDWSYSALWNHLRRTSPGNAAACLIDMTVPESAMDLTADILCEVIGNTARSTLSIAHRSIEALAKFGCGPHWANSSVERCKPSDMKGVVLLGSLQRVEVACRSLGPAQPAHSGEEMAETIGQGVPPCLSPAQPPPSGEQKAPPCLKVGDHAFALPESFGILGSLRVLPTPLEAGWRKHKETVNLLRTFLRDILAKRRIGRDDEKLAAGVRKDMNRLITIMTCLRDTITNSPPDGVAKACRDLDDGPELELMIAYWAFYLRTTEKLRHKTDSGKKRQCLDASAYSVVGANTVTEFLNEPGITGLLRLRHEISLDDDAATAAGALHGIVTDNYALSCLERAGPPPETGGAADRLHVYLSEISRACVVPIPSVPDFDARIGDGERAAWEKMLRDYPDGFDYRRKQSDLVMKYIDFVLVRKNSVASFISEYDLDKKAATAVIAKIFPEMRKKYWPEVGRANFIELYGFEPFIPNGLAKSDGGEGGGE